MSHRPDTLQRPRALRQSLRLAVALLLLVAGSSAHALDGDRILLDASLATTYDDNLVRVPSFRTPQSERIDTESVGGQLHLQQSRQLYDLGFSLARNQYQRFSQENYSANSANGRFTSDIGNHAHVELTASQSQALTPLSAVQTLVRDLITTRSASARVTEDLDARLTLDQSISRQTTRNDFAGLQFNDQASNTIAAGVSYTTPASNVLGLRQSAIFARFPKALQSPFAGQGTQTAYNERRSELFGTWRVTPISTVSATIDYTSHDVLGIAGVNFHGLLGRLGADLSPGGPWSLGSSLRRDLTGQTILASRVVEIDAAELHGGYVFSALLSGNFSTEFQRRRYSVDQPGFPAHQELNTHATLGLLYRPRHWLSLGLDATGDWQRANPTFFEYLDRRVILSANLQL